MCVLPISLNKNCYNCYHLWWIKMYILVCQWHWQVCLLGMTTEWAVLAWLTTAWQWPPGRGTASSRSGTSYVRCFVTSQRASEQASSSPAQRPAGALQTGLFISVRNERTNDLGQVTPRSFYGFKVIRRCFELFRHCRPVVVVVFVP